MVEVDLEVVYKGTGKDKTIQLAAILDIDETLLTEHYADQAALFGYFSVQLAEADRLLGVAKMNTEQAYAEADAYYRKQYNELEQKYTEAVIRGDVLLDEDYTKALEEQLEAQHNVAVLKSVVNALKMKAEMLISMGAHMRQEYDMTGMSIRHQKMDNAVDEVKTTMKRKRKQ